MRILFIVSARGGSRGVPHKNIVVVGALPLIAYKIIAAKKCRYEHRIIVSTDDEDIAEVAKKYGGEVPFMRPKELATATASSMVVVAHAMDWIEDNDDKSYDYVCLLEPSSPFLSYLDIDAAIAEMERARADTLLGVKEVEVSRNFIFPLDAQGKLSLLYHSIREMNSVRRQDQPKEYTPNGCIYLAKWKYFKAQKLFHSENSLAYIMPDEQSVEIDTPLDLIYARAIVASGKLDLSMWS